MATLQVKNGFFTVDIYRGDTSDIFIDNFRDDDGDPIDLTTIFTELRFQIRRSQSHPPIFSASLSEGSIEIVSDSEGNENSAILIPIADTTEFITGALKADLEGTLADGTIDTIETDEGNEQWNVNVKPDITQ